MATTADDDLRAQILDHARRARYVGQLLEPDLTASATNPRCGDQLEIQLALQRTGVDPSQFRIGDVRYRVRACTLTQASASIMGDALLGCHVSQAAALAHRVQRALTGGRHDLADVGEGLAALFALRPGPRRIPCLLLPWSAFQGCLAQLAGDPLGAGRDNP